MKKQNENLRKKTLQKKRFQKENDLVEKNYKICAIKEVGDFTFAHFQRKMQGRNNSLET
jgi:hypothetical protein